MVGQGTISRKTPPKTAGIPARIVCIRGGKRRTRATLLTAPCLYCYRLAPRNIGTNFAGFVPGMVQNGPEKARTGRIGSDWVRLGQVGPEWAKKGQNRPKMGQNRPKMGQKWPARENKASGAIMYGIYEAFRRNFAGFAEFFGGKHVSGSKIGYGRPKLKSSAPCTDIGF